MGDYFSDALKDDEEAKNAVRKQEKNWVRTETAKYNAAEAVSIPEGYQAYVAYAPQYACFSFDKNRDAAIDAAYPLKDGGYVFLMLKKME